MPDVLHSSLTTADLHEPKGVGAASTEQVYVSDGAGSGTWTTWPFGWGFYEHDTAGQVIGTTPSLIQINGGGGQTNETQLPRANKTASTSLWDTTNYNIIPLAVGDSYLIRLSVPIASKTGSPTIFKIEVDISGAGSPTTVISTRDISTTNTAPFDIQVAFPIFIGSTAFANGVQFFCSTNTGSVTLATGAEILINRIYGEI